jgi:hypothetical protein
LQSGFPSAPAAAYPAFLDALQRFLADDRYHQAADPADVRDAWHFATAARELVPRFGKQVAEMK